MQENLPRYTYALTASDREYAYRHGLSDEDMLAFIADYFIEQEQEAPWQTE